MVFNPLGPDPTPAAIADNIVNSFDPRSELAAPFNTVDQYREPGRVNLNTVVGERDPLDPSRTWSPVYDGLMHRNQDGNFYAGGRLIQLGHRGPAWRDVVMSRRGYIDPMVYAQTNFDSSPMSLNWRAPTFFANPFRESDEGSLVPLSSLHRPGPEASLLRPHPYTPGRDGAWGRANADDPVSVINMTSDGIHDDATEAGALGSDDELLAYTSADPALFGLLRPSNAVSNFPNVTNQTRVPLFSAGTTETSLNSQRNSALRYMPLTRLSGTTTTRSGVFAIWITVGFFEVSPAPDWANANVQTRFLNQRDLYDRVYPDGYQLGRELGSETGDTNRHRGFWIVDRTLPVAFKPGDDVNVEKMILLRREID
jgi:hypothetical protein